MSLADRRVQSATLSGSPALANIRSRDQTIKRQADHVLAAFRYQLLHSLDAWLKLASNEVLWLEIEEDYSVAAPDGTIDVQVKRSAAARPTPRSLQSSDVRDVLDRYWTRSDQGRDSRSRLVFIANSGTAQERDFNFPDNLPGLDYWTRAAQNRDTLSIRQALSALFAGHSIGEWIDSQPSDDELRSRLLRRVHWSLNSRDVHPLMELVRDEIAAICVSKGLLATFANEAVRSLLDRVFETASQRDPQERRLTSLDFHRALEEVAQPTAMLQAQARALSSGPTGLADGADVFITPLTISSAGVTDRQATVDGILRRFEAEPIVWLHGTHGTGKSTLARLLARRIGGAWFVLDLRAVQDDAKAALLVWRELVRTAVQETRIDGIIIDDFVSSAFDALHARVAAFMAVNAGRGLRVIATSSHVPSPARFADFGASPNAAVQAPYFSHDELLAFIRQQGGPSDDSTEAWAQLIAVATNGGHPLLVSAKIASLRARTWPSSALIEDIGPFPSDAVRATREEARRRLLDEIPSDDARQLLRRIGCLFDRADNALVLKLAHAAPPIGNPGDHLAILRGSWLEVLPRDDLRLSPLIADIGRDVAETEALQWRRVAAEHWLSTRVLNERTLPLCFWNAFWGKHNSVLAILCQTIQTLPAQRLQGAAAMLSPMLVLTTDRSIYPDLPPIGVMLRLLQFEVANAVEDAEAARRIAARLFVEIEEEQYEELRLLHISLAVPKILMAANADIPPSVQLDCVRRLRTAQQRTQALDLPDAQAIIASMSRRLDPGVDMAGFLFSVSISRIQDSERMLSMIEALDALNQDDRNNLIDATGTTLGMPPGYFVHNAWADDQLNDRDLRPTLHRLEHMSRIVEAWGRSDVQIELACARSVVLDESLNDREGALAVIGRSIEEYGPIPTLVRQRAKVLSHSGDDGAAVDLIISIEETVGAGHPFDRYLALRDGAVAAARVERFEDALRLFRKALSIVLGQEDDAPRSAGILIDIALTQWTINRRGDAIASLADALDVIERLDPAASRQSEIVHQFARALVGSFWQDLDPYPSQPRPSIVIGQASELTRSSEPLLSVDLKPLADNWRILALCEIELGIDVGVERRSMGKQSGPGMASVEMFIIMARYARALARAELDVVFRLGIAAASAKSIALANIASQALERRAFAEDLIGKTADELVTEGAQEIVECIPLDLLIWHRLHSTWDDRLPARIEQACLAAWGSATAISDVLAAASDAFTGQRNSPAVALAALLRPTVDPTGAALKRFQRDLLLIYCTSISFARRILEPLVVSELTNGWTAVLRNESFALRAPLQHERPMEEALKDMQSSGLRGAARLLRAAAPAVRFPLSGPWEQFLRSLGG